MDETRQMLLTVVVSYWSKDQAMVKELWSPCERGKNNEGNLAVEDGAYG